MRSFACLALVALVAFTCVAAMPVAQEAQEEEALLFKSSAVPQGQLMLADVDGPKKGSWVLYKQCGQSWSGNQLGTSSATICSAGCAMSSVAMILKSKGTDVNPGTLNTWLNGHGGYVSGNLLVWGAVNAFGTTKMYNYYRGSGSLSQSQMQSFIKQNYGIVVNVRNGGHWVLVTGHVDGSTYTVNDPGFNVGSYVYGDMSNFVVYT